MTLHLLWTLMRSGRLLRLSIHHLQFLVSIRLARGLHLGSLAAYLINRKVEMYYCILGLQAHFVTGEDCRE